MRKKFYFIKLDMGVICLITFFVSLSVIAAWFDKVERDLYGVKPGVMLNGEPCSRLMPAEVRLIVEEIAIRYQRLPLEPGIDKETGKITSGRPGCMIDVAETIKQVMAAGENHKVKPVLVKVNPKFTSADLEKASYVQGEYATYFHGSGARFKNIATAVKSLNNTIIWPGEIFSFNEIVGPRTPERGYLPAPVIIGEGHDLDYGGGVCQVSSTLYNAAANAKLQVCERHLHSKPIGYVPAGRDATVAYNYLDLKLKNPGKAPAIIKAGMNNGRIWAQIWGDKAQ
ncbi:MAG TPA: VanW family protein [Syntrophomonadaceae bacterium]|nr:VanW family protein [Syntrophomonadaceae bacterium]